MFIGTLSENREQVAEPFIIFERREMSIFFPQVHKGLRLTLI